MLAGYAHIVECVAVEVVERVGFGVDTATSVCGEVKELWLRCHF